MYTPRGASERRRCASRKNARGSGEGFEREGEIERREMVSLYVIYRYNFELLEQKKTERMGKAGKSDTNVVENEIYIPTRVLWLYPTTLVSTKLLRPRVPLLSRVGIT